MLTLIISHGVFQLFVFKIFQVKYKQEVLEVIEKGVLEDKLAVFVFNGEDLMNGSTKIQWIEENEFRFDNKMYDVVKTETRGDSVYLYCLHDENESRLYTILDECFQQMLDDDPNKVDELTTLNNFLSQFYSKPLDNGNDTEIYEKGKYFTEVNSNLLEGEHFLVIPPPRSKFFFFI